MISTILFDLDGTLLPMDQDVFVRSYFKELAKKLLPLGYEPEKLIQTIWTGTEVMVKNDGTCTNEERFWNFFCEVYGEDARAAHPVFEEFYRTEFQKAAAVCGLHKEARNLIVDLKAHGFRLVLATNPLFPAIATESRIRWAGLEPSDFELYTTYETSHYCKPNPHYYNEILQKLGCKAEECLMIGNDIGEDMIAETLGMHVFLLTDCLINKKNVDITRYPQGNFSDLQNYLFSL